MLRMLSKEYWYGGAVQDGIRMPVGEEDDCCFGLSCNRTQNQSMPLFISSRGRYLWRREGFDIHFKKGEIICPEDVTLSEGHENLRGAFMAAVRELGLKHECRLDKRLFDAPVFNTWIEMTFHQNEKDIMKYAENILENGYRPGILMIDDGWSESYGTWRFHSGKFREPEKFLDRLHEMGFGIMLWICPFVTPDTESFRDACDRDILMKNADGEVYICRWWNGWSAVLDMTNPAAEEWLDSQLAELMRLGVDGFKMDAGDSSFYEGSYQTFRQATPDEHSRLWAAYGEKFALNEYRATANAGGYSLMQRLCDKEHSWGEKGLAALIPDSLVQEITGHPFCCPDMIGGGEYRNFLEEEKGGLDSMIFIRHAQAAALMPVMQFSAAPWRVLTKECHEQVKESVRLREKYRAQRLAALEKAAADGEPIVRYMEYVFPGQGMERVTDQFMLGDTILAAPVTRPGTGKRSVHVPAGRWRYRDAELESSGGEMEFEDASLIVLERR